MKRLLFAALAVLGYAGLAMAPSASSIATEPTATPFTIRSSLDGRAFLPHRIRWIAYASRPVLFPGVEFLIDGKVVFANRLVPYAFADDGRDEASGTRKTGYLVTSWLTPGPHAFTVRGKALVGGRRRPLRRRLWHELTALRRHLHSLRERGNESSRLPCLRTRTSCTATSPPSPVSTGS
jgi:hypothetical protein